jgi:hypothetical protein
MEDTARFHLIKKMLEQAPKVSTANVQTLSNPIDCGELESTDSDINSIDTSNLSEEDLKRLHYYIRHGRSAFGIRG